jgi:hypothetical protein
MICKFLTTNKWLKISQIRINKKKKEFDMIDTFNLNSISAEYRVFSQTIVTLPPNSMVNLPMRIPIK